MTGLMVLRAMVTDLPMALFWPSPDWGRVFVCERVDERRILDLSLVLGETGHCWK